MKSIKVYGPGCAKCNDMAAIAKEAALNLDLNVSVEKVTDVMQFAVAGVIVTPALVIDGKVIVSGRVPSKEEMQVILQSEANDAANDRQPSSPAKAPVEPSCCCDSGGCCGSASDGITGKGEKTSGPTWFKIAIWLVVIASALAAIKFANRKARETDTGTNGVPRTAFYHSGKLIEGKNPLFRI